MDKSTVLQIIPATDAAVVIELRGHVWVAPVFAFGLIEWEDDDTTGRSVDPLISADGNLMSVYSLWPAAWVYITRSSEAQATADRVAKELKLATAHEETP